ncbi:MAG: bifunctional DNA-binding transcriptional regulator/O6-methylguanine-DNA methyltransferase Ada [Gammaproteobacteria bacterium]
MAGTSTSPSSDDLRWNAVVDRDHSLDREFVYAVRTTGIYCRPSCPSRQSKRENTVFFASPVEAEHAGYRECLRCGPTRPSVEERRVEAVRAACAAIDKAEQAPTLHELAAAVGVSPSHLHRQFKRLVGVTPREYAAGKRVSRLRDRLRTGRPVADAIYAAGFGSSSRVYETAKRTLGMTPGQYRDGGRNVAIEFTVTRSPLGHLLVAATDQGICCIEFGNGETMLRERLAERFPAARLKENDDDLRRCVADITAFIRTPRHGLRLPLDIQGTAFQHRVWKALQAIPPGRTASYREVAAAIGQPTAHRAVARACSANKLALAIPCHRVVRTDGQLGGYRWGLERKRRLLEREAAVNERVRTDRKK